jgi:hypothetical protein
MMVAANQRLQGEQSVMTNLSFALDSMTREIRTGTNYYCDWSVNKSGVFGEDTDVDDEHGNGTQDCANGNPSPSTNYFVGMSFKEGGESITSNSPGDPDRVLYYFDRSQGKIIRKIGTSEAQLTSSGIYIKNFDVFVSGSEPLTSSDTEQDQASVTLFIEAAETADPNQKSYFLQTTISQRTLDI